MNVAFETMIEKGRLLSVRPDGTVEHASDPRSVIGIAGDSKRPVTASQFANRLTDYNETVTAGRITVYHEGTECYISMDNMESETCTIGELLTCGADGKFRVAMPGEQAFARVVAQPQLLASGIPSVFPDSSENILEYVRIQYFGQQRQAQQQPSSSSWGNGAPSWGNGSSSWGNTESFTEEDLMGIEPVPEPKKPEAIDMDKRKKRKYID